MAKSTSHERRIPFYAKPRQEALVKAYAESKGESYSKVIGDGVDLFFRSMPPQDRANLLAQAKKKTS